MPKPPVELLAGTANASIILLHGLGADGFDLAPVAQALDLPDVRFILPHAEPRPVTINGGYVMPAWYDIYQPDLSRGQDDAGFAQAREIVANLIRHEVARGISSTRIILAGFSQGGAVALYSGLTLGLPLAGIAALSAYLPQLPTAVDPTLPIWAAHGTRDEIIPLSMSQASYARLAESQLEMHLYPMAHEISMNEIADLRVWLQTQIG